jgi:EmrB/QacA subfamily drug resistance transporter
LASTSRTSETLIVLVTILGTGMVYLDQTALTVALPTMQVAFHTDVAGLQWLVDIYILTLACLLLIGGALGDRYGRVRVYVIGMILFTLASIVCGATNSLGALIAARALQGIGGALLVPGSLAILNATIPPERRGHAIGLWSSFAPLIALVGPVVGGTLVDSFSWRIIFFLNVPLGILASILALRYIPENKDPHATGSLDYPGILALMVGLAGIIFAIIEGPQQGPFTPSVLTALVIGLIGLVAFIFIESRSANPIMPLKFFRNLTFTGINLVTLVLYLALSGVFFFLVINLQQAQGYSARDSGLAQLPASVILAVLATPVGRLSNRFGPKRLMLIGIILCGVAFLMFGRLGLEANYWTSFFPAVVVFGLGLAFFVVPLTAVALTSLPDRFSGISSGVNNAATRIAQMLAVAIFGAMLASGFRAALMDNVRPLDLEPPIRDHLIADSRNLGAIEIPPTLPLAQADSVRQVVRLSLVDSSRTLMVVCAALCVLAALITAFLIRDPQRPIPSNNPEMLSHTIP